MSWPLIKLGELVDINIGRTPSRDRVDYWGEGFSWLSIRDMNQGKSLVSTAEEITSLAVKESKIKSAPEGTVLFSFKLSIGKVGIAKKELFHNEAIAALPILDANILCAEYLYFALKQLNFSEDTDRAVMGQTLNKKKLAELEIPLPPLSIQKQIAAILEKADQLRKDCQQMEQELNNLAQSVFIDMFGDPVSNPKGWKSASIKSISNKFNDGPFGSNLKTSHYQDEGVQVIRLTNIGSGYFKNDSQAFVSEEHAKTLEKFKCYPGDIVIATLGDPNLRACIIPEEVPVAINKADCVCCVPNAEFVRAEYLVEYLNLPFTLQSIQNMLHGQTRTRISSGQLGQVKILVPPLKKQDEFLKLIKVRNAELSRHKYLHIEIDELFNSLIQQAFNGELKLKHQAA